MIKFGVLCLTLVLLGCQEGSALTGGSKTTVKKHPYQVAIDMGGTFACSGALLTPTTVVTAASCFIIGEDSDIDVSSIQVRVGALFREKGGEIYQVTDYAVNPDFSPYGGYSDVALLYLEAAVPIREEVKTISLADPNIGLQAGENLIITGYGDLYENEQLAEDEMRQLMVISVPAFNTDLCSDLFYFTDDDNRACAGGWGTGICGERDIGSPVVNWLGELVGVALMQRSACGVLGQPSVFQSLVDAEVWAWLDDNVGGPAASST